MSLRLRALLLLAPLLVVACSAGAPPSPPATPGADDVSLPAVQEATATPGSPAASDGQIAVAAPDTNVGEPSCHDERRSVAHPRARALVVVELNALEGLFRATATDAPDRVTLARRLAEDYVELESGAWRERTRAEAQRDALRATRPALAAQHQSVANQAATIMARARSKAEAYYDLIVDGYPSYPEMFDVLDDLACEHAKAKGGAGAEAIYRESAGGAGGGGEGAP